MVSICVPTYNYDARPLLRELRRQLAYVTVPVEILVYDDASPYADRVAPGLIADPRITYKVLEHNHGRAAIRNRMVRDAKHAFILLLDVDCAVPTNFLRRYLTVLESYPQSEFDTVFVGGRVYQPETPTDASLHLHWWYGTTRESVHLAEKSNPYHGFHSNNFIAPRQLLLRHPFSESALGYGHEDTLWGQQLRHFHASIKYVQNPVTHLGLEDGRTFLAKQRQAIENLIRLKGEYTLLTTRLTKLVNFVPFIGSFARLVPEQWLVNYLLNNRQPDLRALDILKLRWYTELGLRTSRSDPETQARRPHSRVGRGRPQA